MRAPRMAVVTLVLGLATFGTACFETDSVTEPTVHEPSAALLDGDLLSEENPVEVLRRSPALAEDEEVTQVIGPDGGTIDLPNAGLTVLFPPNALDSPTTITVLAPAGDLVGYHFEPHGLQFQAKVGVVQDLTVTEAGLLESLAEGDLTAAYFEGDLEPIVDALELLELHILGSLGLGAFKVEHFSGYVIATN